MGSAPAPASGSGSQPKLFPGHRPSWSVARASSGSTNTSRRLLPNLAYLDLTGCGVEQLLPTVAEMDSLKSLCLNDNRLHSLPDALAALRGLTILEVEDNPLVTVPEALSARKGLHLVTGVPDEILPGLYLGDARAARNVEALQQRQVHRVIMVSCELRPQLGAGLDTVVIPIKDVPSETLAFARCVDPYFYRFAMLAPTAQPSVATLRLRHHISEADAATLPDTVLQSAKSHAPASTRAGSPAKAEPRPLCENGFNPGPSQEGPGIETTELRLRFVVDRRVHKLRLVAARTGRFAAAIAAFGRNKGGAAAAAAAEAAAAVGIAAEEDTDDGDSQDTGSVFSTPGDLGGSAGLGLGLGFRQRFAADGFDPEAPAMPISAAAAELAEMGRTREISGDGGRDAGASATPTTLSGRDDAHTSDDVFAPSNDSTNTSASGMPAPPSRASTGLRRQTKSSNALSDMAHSAAVPFGAPKRSLLGGTSSRRHLVSRSKTGAIAKADSPPGHDSDTCSSRAPGHDVMVASGTAIVAPSAPAVTASVASGDGSASLSSGRQFAAHAGEAAWQGSSAVAQPRRTSGDPCIEGGARHPAPTAVLDTAAGAPAAPGPLRAAAHDCPPMQQKHRGASVPDLLAAAATPVLSAAPPLAVVGSPMAALPPAPYTREAVANSSPGAVESFASLAAREFDALGGSGGVLPGNALVGGTGGQEMRDAARDVVDTSRAGEESLADSWASIDGSRQGERDLGLGNAAELRWPPNVQATSPAVAPRTPRQAQRPSPFPVPVFVHCQAGASRSASIVIALVMRTTGWCLHRSFTHVKRCRSVVSPNMGFFAQLQRFEQTLYDAGLIRLQPDDPQRLPTLSLKAFLFQTQAPMDSKVWAARYGSRHGSNGSEAGDAGVSQATSGRFHGRSNTGVGRHKLLRRTHSKMGRMGLMGTPPPADRPPIEVAQPTIPELPQQDASNLGLSGMPLPVMAATAAVAAGRPAPFHQARRTASAPDAAIQGTISDAVPDAGAAGRPPPFFAKRKLPPAATLDRPRPFFSRSPRAEAAPAASSAPFYKARKPPPQVKEVPASLASASILNALPEAAAPPEAGAAAASMPDEDVEAQEQGEGGGFWYDAIVPIRRDRRMRRMSVTEF